LLMVSGKEGTVSTASRNCRNHGQRLQVLGFNAPRASGSPGRDPWIIRSTCPKRHCNSSGKHQIPCDLEQCESKPLAKTAAFPEMASSHTTQIPLHLCICRLEARTGTSPPLYSSHNSRAPPGPPRATCRIPINSVHGLNSHAHFPASPFNPCALGGLHQA
jgi:hypothetical protein